METRSWTHIDRTGWGPGPWDGEPDQIQWQDIQTGMPCLAVRHPEFGHWCGYVGVTPDHPLYGVSYGACARKDHPCLDDNDLDRRCVHSPKALLKAHGGLTFSGPCTPGAPEGEGEGICHVVGPGEEADVWWLGFDCSQFCDYPPGLAAMINRASAEIGQRRSVQLFDVGSYKTLGYVQVECRRLAMQLDDRDFAATHELEG